MVSLSTTLKMGAPIFANPHANTFLDGAGALSGLWDILFGKATFNTGEFARSVLFGGLGSHDTAAGDTGELIHSFALSSLKTVFKSLPGAGAAAAIKNLATAVTEFSRALIGGTPTERLENIMEGITETVAAFTTVMPGGAIAAPFIQKAVKNIIHKTVLCEFAAKIATSPKGADIIAKGLAKHPGLLVENNPAQTFLKIIEKEPGLLDRELKQHLGKLYRTARRDPKTKDMFKEIKDEPPISVRVDAFATHLGKQTVALASGVKTRANPYISGFVRQVRSPAYAQ